MLDPDVVLATVVTAFQSIPALVAEMADDPANISGHFYTYGTEESLIQTIFRMTSPSILIAYQDMLGGNFDGEVIWKHRLEAYIRPANRAAITRTGGIGGALPASPPHLWWMMMNLPILDSSCGIRYHNFLDGSLQIMDTPTLTHRQDETGADFFVGSLVWPEAGDD